MRLVLLLALAPTALAQGDPTFGASVQNPFGLERIGAGVRSAPALADLDGDGDVDLVAGDFNGGLFYFENTAGPGAAPAFAEPVDLPFGADPPEAFSTSPAIADLDTDGDLDLLVGEEDGTYRVYLNGAGAAATPAFEAPLANPYGLTGGPTGSFTFLSPAAADLDGDGDTDVLSGSGSGGFTYFENTAGAGAAPVFARPVADPFGLADVGDASTLAVTDLDGDGDADVLAAGRTAFFFFRNTAGPGATPAFEAATQNPFNLAPESNGLSPAVADVDGDGDLDVISGESVGNFYLFENGPPPISTEPEPDRALALAAPVPNPARGAVHLEYSLAAAAEVRLAVVDARGREVTVAARGLRGAGAHRVAVPLAGLAPGAYVARLEAGGAMRVRRFAVVR